MKQTGKLLSEILAPAGLKLPAKAADPRIHRLAIDSRRVAPSSLFFALPGARVDGNAFIDEALARGAVAVVSHSPRVFGKPSFPFIACPNPRLALAQVARGFFSYPDKALGLVGVTGTNGKTTVVGLLKHLLSGNEEPRIGSLGTIAYDLVERSVPSFRTTPEAHDLSELLSQMRDFGCSRAVMEVSSHGIDQLRVAELEFEAAAFLNLTRDHLDYHQDMESYFEVKARLFRGEVGPTPRRMAINADDPYGRRLIDELGKSDVISFGFAEGATVKAEDAQLAADGSRFLMHWPDGSCEVALPMIGSYNISNALAAFALCYSLGQDMEASVERLGTFRGIPGRMEVVDPRLSVKVLVDYAHTPDALGNALSMLREICEGRLIVVFGCGGNRDRGKRAEMTRVAQKNADFCWATADNPRSESLEQIFEDMRKGVSDEARIAFIPDRRRAIEKALKSAQEGDIALIAGKGHESFQEFGNTVVSFDDRRVARELLELKLLGESNGN